VHGIQQEDGKDGLLVGTVGKERGGEMAYQVEEAPVVEVEVAPMLMERGDTLVGLALH
jgi:hypothetical protein